MKQPIIITIFAIIFICLLLIKQTPKTPLVSVVMPTYNRANLLNNAINSILNQTHKNFELIIIDDGSKDNTENIVLSYNNPKIRYHSNQTNKGISYSRNKGFNLAKGKYIMIMDDDDFSLPDRMEKQVNFLENNPNIDVVIGQIKDFELTPLFHDQIALELLQHNPIGNANIMYRKDFAQKHNITYNEDLPISEDWNYWLDMLFSGAKFHAITDIVLLRNITSHKYHSGNFEDGNIHIRKKISLFFDSKNDNSFYETTNCNRVKMITDKNLVSQSFLQHLYKINCY